MDRFKEKLANTHCELDDILIATVGRAKKEYKIVTEVLKTLHDDRGLAINLGYVSFLTHKLEWLRFKIDAIRTMP